MPITEKQQKTLDALTEQEMTLLLSHFKDTDLKPKSYEHFFSNKHVKFGVISDTHIGEKAFDEELLLKAFKYFKKEKVDAIYHVGDISEGMSGREGHIYALNKIGFTNQINYIEELFKQTDKQIFAITGNHDQWYQKKNNSGADIGVELERRLPNFKYLGMNEADVKLTHNITMKLFHPNDGTAYAPGYKLMKLIESFGGGEKPNILLQGHYHKALYMFSRNIHSYEAGTLCGQTEFMRLKKIQAHKGFWIIDAYLNNKGVDRVKNTFIPKYD